MLRKDTSPIESNAANWVCSDLQPDAAMSIPVPYRRVMRRIVSVYWLMVDVEGRREVSLADFRSIRLEKRSGLNCRVFFFFFCCVSCLCTCDSYQALYCPILLA